MLSWRGDVVILTKEAAIEATGLFAVTFPDRVAQRYGEKAARAAEEIFWRRKWSGGWATWGSRPAWWVRSWNRRRVYASSNRVWLTN